MSLATGPDGAATDSATELAEPVVLSLDERSPRSPVVAAAKGIVRGGAAGLQKVSPKKLLSSFRTRSRDPSPVRPDRPAAPAPAMPNFEAWHGPSAASTALNLDVVEPAGLTGAVVTPPPSGVSGAVPSIIMPQQLATAVPAPPPPPSSTAVSEPAHLAIGVPAPPTPPPAIPTHPAPQSKSLTAAPEAREQVPSVPSPPQLESSTTPRARKQAHIGIDDQSDAQLEQGLASSKMKEYMGADGDATLQPSHVLQTPDTAEGEMVSKVPDELVLADEEDGGVMRSHSSFTFDTPPPPVPANSEEVAPLLGSSPAPKSAPDVNSHPLEPADTDSSDIPSPATPATAQDNAAVTPSSASGGNGGKDAAREGYVLLNSDSAPTTGEDVTDSAVPPQESMNTVERDTPPAIEPVSGFMALTGAAPGLMLQGAPLAAHAPETQAAGTSTDETTAADATPVATPTGVRDEGHHPPPTFAADTQGAGIASDEPTAVEAELAAASALDDTEPLAALSAVPAAVPAADNEGVATPALDLGQEPAVEADVADGMGLRAGATPVEGGADVSEAAEEQVEDTDAPASGVAEGGNGQSFHATASASDEIALLKKSAHETAVAYRDQAVDVTHNKLKLRQGTALGTSTAIILRGLATLAAYVKVLLIAIVLGLLRGIWFLAVQSTRFTGPADAAAPANAPPDSVVASKVHKASKVTADAVANAAEATANAAKLNEE